MKPALLTLWVLALLGTGCHGELAPPESFWKYPSEWLFEEPALWDQQADTLILSYPGSFPESIRRPASVATVGGTEALSSFTLRAEVRSTQSPDINGRDVLIVFGYQGPDRFYYAHLSNDNTIMPHNGIFLVDGSDRRRIDDQWPESRPAARMTDLRWHTVRLDRNALTGEINVFLDDLKRPLITAVDSTLLSGAIGFGSFDDTGMIRGLRWAEGLPPILDPVPQTPQPARLALTLAPFTQIPPSDTTGGPMARINHLSAAGDGTNRLFVPDLRGRLYLVKDSGSKVYLNVAEWFGDFVSEPGLGSGLGFVAFHPTFRDSGLFYTVHTEAGTALSHRRPDFSSGHDIVHGVLTEWRVNDPFQDTFEGTHREVMRIGFRTVLHGIQQIGFNPVSQPGDDDYGLLYMAVGDGEAPGMQSDGPQSLSSPHGKILRIDPLRVEEPGGAYSIPISNPFTNSRGALGEIWAYGLRNPHRFGWDTASGVMYISHIGEAQVDAVFIGREGANYGWNNWEGGYRYEREDPLLVYPPLKAGQGVDAPVVVMDHDDMAALVGGGVYRGALFESMQGTYLFADLATGSLFEVLTEEMATLQPTPRNVILRDQEGKETSMARLAGRQRAEIRFGWDEAGEMYLLSKANGMIWKVDGAEVTGSDP